MPTFKHYTDMEVWQTARELTKEFYAISKQGAFAKDFGLRDQIRRASVSILSNIAEGFERNGTGEFIQFLGMAKGSTGEVETQLYVAFDQSYISQEGFGRMVGLTNKTSRMLGGLMIYLRRSGIKGSKYKIAKR